MPIIHISQKDIDKGKPISDGWHLFEIETFAESDSKDKGSKNWLFELRCIEKTEDEGRYGYARFNSKRPGILIQSGFLPSALDTSVEKEINFNPDEILKRTLYGLVTTEIYEGKPQKKCDSFCPASAPPF